MRRLLAPMLMTSREKRAMLDGTNLFFGALLGANLGTVDQLPPGQYAILIILLAFTVMVLRNFSMSERRGQAVGLLVSYVVLVPLVLYSPRPSVRALEASDRDNLAITLAAWVGVTLLAELLPTREVEAAADDAGRGAPEAAAAE